MIHCLFRNIFARFRLMNLCSSNLFSRKMHWNVPDGQFNLVSPCIHMYLLAINMCGNDFSTQIGDSDENYRITVNISYILSSCIFWISNIYWFIEFICHCCVLLSLLLKFFNSNLISSINSSNFVAVDLFNLNIWYVLHMITLRSMPDKDEFIFRCYFFIAFSSTYYCYHWIDVCNKFNEWMCYFDYH